MSCSDYVGVSHEDAIPLNVDALVNCAGLAGQGKCKDAQYTEVIRANVRLPLRLANTASIRKIPLIQLSTSGVYRKQTSVSENDVCAEDSPVFPRNEYTASKILMETLIQQRFPLSYVFRIPFFADRESLISRVANWSEVQNTYCSLVDVGALDYAIKNCMSAEPGIYNIASRVVYFPDFVDDLVGGPIMRRSEVLTDMTSSVVLDTSKAREGYPCLERL